MARSPQGQPVVLHAGTSDRSRQLAAREADVIFAGVGTISQGVDYASDIRRRAIELGRNPDENFILPGLTPVVGATPAEARAIYDELNSLIVLDDDVASASGARGWPLDPGAVPRGEGVPPGYRNLGALSQRLGLDITSEPVDSVVAPDVTRALAPGGTYHGLDGGEAHRQDCRRHLTWRDVLRTHTSSAVMSSSVGPEEIADYIEAWLRLGPRTVRHRVPLSDAAAPRFVDTRGPES